MKKGKKSPLPIIIGVVVVAVIAGAVAIAATHKSSMSGMSMASSPAASANTVETNSVTISNYSFGPAAIKVKAGTTVTWTNQDGVEHTVTGDNGGPSSALFGRGASYTYTFAKAGTYTYHCMPHPYMKGTVVVTD